MRALDPEKHPFSVGRPLPANPHWERAAHAGLLLLCVPFLAFDLLRLAVHESGYALVGLALGCRLYRFQLGVGRPILSRHLRWGFRLVLRCPVRFAGELTGAGVGFRGNVPWKAFVAISLAGVAADTAFAVLYGALALALTPHWYAFFPGFAVLPAVLSLVSSGDACRAWEVFRSARGQGA